MPANQGDLIFAGTVQKTSVTTSTNVTPGSTQTYTDEYGNEVAYTGSSTSTATTYQDDYGNTVDNGGRVWVPGHWVRVGSRVNPDWIGPDDVWVEGYWKTVGISDVKPVYGSTGGGSSTYTISLSEFLKLHYSGTKNGDVWDMEITAFVCTSSPGKKNYDGYLDGKIKITQGNVTEIATLTASAKNAKGSFGDYGVYAQVMNGSSPWSMVVHGITDDAIHISIEPNSKSKFYNTVSGASAIYTFETGEQIFTITGGPPPGQNEPSAISSRELGTSHQPVVLDTEFKVVAFVDDYESFIWTDRYNASGDFELVLPASSAAVEVMQQDYYLYRSSSYYLMIIESVKLEADAEDGDKLIVSGRSLESILERRVIWNQTVFSEEANTDHFQNAIKTLLDQNLMNPSDEKRKIPNFKFRWCYDPAIAELSVNTEFDGESLYSAIHDLCEAGGVGFRLLPDADWNFVFELYVGSDHSYSQPDPPAHPYVVFSPSFDNLSNSNYLSTTEPYRNTALIAGEGEGAERKKAEVCDAEEAYSGLARREIFVDAKSTSTKTDDDREMTEEEYRAILEGKGYEELANNTKEVAFDGEALPMIGFQYGDDYSLGDVVQIQNAYGLGARARVTEYIMSDSTDGYEEYPTFEVIE